MDFEIDSFTAGFGLIIIAFAFAWAFGLVAKLLDVAGD